MPGPAPIVYLSFFDGFFTQSDPNCPSLPICQFTGALYAHIGSMALRPMITQYQFPSVAPSGVRIVGGFGSLNLLLRVPPWGHCPSGVYLSFLFEPI
ncbi:hypothetical protein Tco_0535992 [Tanacetum coccineum]